jgi:hypothetical protein
VGESLWIWLRPGLARENLLERLDQIAVACWADKVTIERASATNAALVRIDITRRDALTGTVASPLPTEVSTTGPASGENRPIDGDENADTAEITDTSGLDITDVTEDRVTNADSTVVKNGARSKRTATVPAVADDDPYADYR